MRRSAVGRSGDVGARRVTVVVVIGVVLAAIGLYSAFTAASLVSDQIGGDRTWTGLPGAAAILGTAAGAAVLSNVMARAGRRRGIILGWVAGACGGAIAVLGMSLASLALVVVAMVVVGFGNGATQLARFAAADAHPPARRGSVISLVVWVSAIGAVSGPLLLRAGAVVAAQVRLHDLAGVFSIAAAAFACAAIVSALWLRPDPPAPSGGASADAASAASRAPATWDRLTTAAVVSLVAAQFAMVLIMIVTPVHVSTSGHGLTAVGGVLSAHVLGMFGLSPVFGRLVDRVGALGVTLGGLAVLAGAGLLAAAAPAHSAGVLSLALFGVGLGWSATFVASSTLVASATVVVQGRVDALGWGVAAVAAVAGGVVLGQWSYAVVCFIAIAVMLLAFAVVISVARTKTAAQSI